jgi:hypothetical protein
VDPKVPASLMIETLHNIFELIQYFRNVSSDFIGGLVEEIAGG